MISVAIAVLAYIGGALSTLVALAFGRAARDPEIVVVVRSVQTTDDPRDVWSVN